MFKADNSGALDKQANGTENMELIPSKPLEGLHMAKVIDGLTVSHSKSLGDEVASALLAGATTQLACDYQEVKLKFNELSNKFDIQRNTLEKSRIENAILKQIINSDRGNKHLRNFAITIRRVYSN